MVTKNKKSKVSKKVWFLFDLRGEYHGHFGVGANGDGVLMLKKGDYDSFLLSLGKQVGDPEELDYNYIVKDVDVEETHKLFDDEGFTIQKATNQDFDELKRELDKLETIKGGESEKYKRGKGS
tara:strand:+ start:5787 stop:6155 length:369 start_codon:yes stop_codon:yes gene_type:complete